MNNDKVIGGFFELELQKKTGHYHLDAIQVNSGRNALKLLLHTLQPAKLYIPYYICSSVVNAVEECCIPYEQYYLDPMLYPTMTSPLPENEYLLYVNYFGVIDENVRHVSEMYDRRVIIDNTQAFYSKPSAGVYHTFYSPRKFFGVPDGGYIYSAANVKTPNEVDISYNRCEHLLSRAEEILEGSYQLFQMNEKRIDHLPIKKMSCLTQRILESIDYELIRETRKSNFLFLHNYVKHHNHFSISIDHVYGPMIYPLLITNRGLREFLIANKVYVAKYWEDVTKKVPVDTFEYCLSQNLVPLPIDHRYNTTDMKYIADLIEKFLSY
ncbi:hypothetical protein [Brevibacillus panacihumi]|uniref:hypothetical protein n=1 Tax=Brevibacillus panacihumi TaxID=497735 RepID=UPI003D257ED7